MKVSGITLKDLFERQELFLQPSKRLSYNALRNIVNGFSEPRHSTLLTLCSLLGVSLIEIIEDTELSKIFLIRHKNRIDTFTTSDSSTKEPIIADIVSSPDCQARVAELILKPGQSTVSDSSPLDGVKYRKIIYCLEGRLTVVVDSEKKILNRRDTATIDSTKPHYFQNAYIKKCAALITLIPKHF